jgi:hypothetical protein
MTIGRKDFLVKGQFQSSVRVKIQVPASIVGGIIRDITLIPRSHPEAGKANLLLRLSKPDVDVRSQCPGVDAQERRYFEGVAEQIPEEKIPPTMQEESSSVDKMLSGFIVETALYPADDSRCILQFDAYYTPIGWWNSVLNALIFRRAFEKRSRAVMKSIKRLAEAKRCFFKETDKLLTKEGIIVHD